LLIAILRKVDAMVPLLKESLDGLLKMVLSKIKITNTKLSRDLAKIKVKNTSLRMIRSGKDKLLKLKNSKKPFKTDQFTSQCKLNLDSNNGITTLLLSIRKLKDLHLLEDTQLNALDGALIMTESINQNSAILNLITGFVLTLGERDGDIMDFSIST